MKEFWIGILMVMISIFIIGLVAWVKQIEISMPVKFNNNIVDVYSRNNNGGLKWVKKE